YNATDDPAPSLHPHRAQQGLHRYYEPVRQHTPDRYSIPYGFIPTWDTPSRRPQPSETPVPGHAFPRSLREQQIRLTTPTCQTPPGQSTAIRRASPKALQIRLGFDVTYYQWTFALLGSVYAA